ncbi:uncharacterized protein DS421_12g371580 [Arachis hypogaea]|nr:uncharacterized protein DS421_12g371580 [Arachis hypogaea]
MDPQAFIRLSIGSLGLRCAGIEGSSGRSRTQKPPSPFVFPLISSTEAILEVENVATSFYLEESDLKALLAPCCFYNTHAGLEIVIFSGRKGSHCGVGPEWREGKPLTLFSGWIGIGKRKPENGWPVAELHVRVKLDPDARYVFQFEDGPSSSQSSVSTVKFTKDRISQIDPLSNYWCGSTISDLEIEREREKGGRSNPGAWLIVRPDACRPESWQPWGKLEAWRERGLRDSVCFRFHVLSEAREGGELLMSEIFLSAEKGGEFFIDTERHMRTANASANPVPSPQSSGDFGALTPVGGGFVMSCRVQGEGKRSKPLVQLALRHVTCVEDAAIFMALEAAVDLSIEACRPFRRKIRRGFRHSF